MMSGFTRYCRVGQASLALAAVLGQEIHQSVHARKLDSVNQIATATLLRDQIGMQQLFEVKGQRSPGTDSISPNTAGVMPAEPCTTSAQNICKRFGCANAAKALTTSLFPYFHYLENI